jgi:hypothetical protein
MPFEMIAVDDGVLRLRLSGVLTRLDMDHTQTAVRDAIDRHATIKVLVILDDFGGWQSGVDWGDLSFAQETDAQIEKIAVVGDAAWKEDVMTFMVAPLRATEIQYFERAHTDAANRWLA